MALTFKERFKLGFIARCVREGMTAGEIADACEKAAADLRDPAKRAGALDWALGVGVPLALLAPPAVGAGIGYAAGRASDVDDVDIQEVRDRELVNEYRRQAAMARQEAAARRVTGREPQRQALVSPGGGVA